MAKQKSEEVEGQDNSKLLLQGFLKETKADHLNFEKQVSWTVSTGSLLFDSAQGGGFGPGAYKVCGASSAGKTHLSLGCIKNGLETVPKSKGFWIVPEGRLDEKVKARTALKFVYSAEEWDYGTCFVFETNVFEVAFDAIHRLTKENPDKNVYFMGIDSIDCLIRKDDIEKSVGEGEKVAAAGTLSSNLFKKINLRLNKLGHCLFVLDQVRAHPKINQYEAANPNDSVGKGGANATIHAANQVWSLRGRSKSKNIEEKGKIIGHYCCIDVSKGLDEKIDVRVEYPVRHRMKGGKSVWLEKEIADLLIQWELVEKRGSWLSFSPDLLADLKTGGFDIEDTFQVQGDAKLKDWLEQNPEIVDFLYKKFLKMFTEE